MQPANPDIAPRAREEGDGDISRGKHLDADQGPHGDSHLKREQWFRKGRTVRGESAAALRYRAYREKLRMRQTAYQSSSRSSTAAAGATQTTSAVIGSGPAWTSLGPAALQSDPSGVQDYGFNVGRTTAVVVDQGDTSGNTLYIGGAYGGVWKSTNAANSDPAAVTWTPLTDNEATLAIGAIGVQPTSGGASNVILAGTGEPNSSADSYYGLGILRSTDAGQTWSLITTADGGTKTLKGLGFSKIAFSKDNPNLVVASATSTPVAVDVNIDPALTKGIYYSSDAGATWHYATVQESPGNPINPNNAASSSVSSVVFHALQHKFYAAVRYHGFYSSTDGITWTRMATQPGSGLTTVACPAQTSTNCPLYRGEIAVRPGSQDEMYAWYVDDAETNQGIYKSTDGGASWSSLSVAGITNCGDVDGGCDTQQGTYNLVLTAVPNGSTTDLYAGAINIYKCNVSTADPTCNVTGFKNLTHAYGCGASPGGYGAPAHVHPDQHAFDFSVSVPSVVYFGNDGGIYRTLNSAGVSSGACDVSNPFDNLARNMGSMSQIVWLSNHPTDDKTLLIGLQDGGSGATDAAHSGTSGTVWVGVNSGDGGYNDIDPSSPNVFYTANSGVSIERCASGTSCTSNTFPDVITSAQVGNDGSTFYPPYMLDPKAPSKMIVSTCRVWRGNADGTAWSASNALSNNFDTGTATACSGTANNMVSALAAGGPAANDGTSQVIYAATEAGVVFVTTNAAGGTGTWTVSNGFPNSGGFKVSSVAIDPSDATGRTAYITLMGFGGGHVFKTTNVGGAWTDITGNLPDAPADTVLVDPLNPAYIYAGTDIGVYITKDGGATWAEYGTGFPNVPVTTLKVFSSGGVKWLRASTYGRGAWQTQLATNLVGILQSNAASLDFGTVVVGTSDQRTVTLTNAGAAALNLTVQGPGGNFPINGTTCGASLAAAASCTVTLKFAPPAAGNSSANLTLSNTSSGSTLNVALSGTGTDFMLSRVRRPSRPAAPGPIAPGGTATYSVNLAGMNGFRGTVVLTCSGLPRGAACVAPRSIELDGTAARVDINVAISTTATARTRTRSSLRLGDGRVISGTAPGSYTVRLNAVSQGVRRSVDLELLVR